MEPRLPEWRHVPGRNPRPPETQSGPGTDTWRLGLRLIRHGYFWEAHEALEPLWAGLPPNGRERFLVQGAIHLANAALKRRMGRPRAAARLDALATDCLGRALAGQAELMGVTASGLRALVAEGESVAGMVSDHAL